VGSLQDASDSFGHVVVWSNGSPAILPDAPIAGACTGSGCTCSTAGGSTAYGMNAAGHIAGSTTYPSKRLGDSLVPAIGSTAEGTSEPCRLPYRCSVNNSRGPPYIPPSGFPAQDPALIQTNGTYSFLPLGSLAAAASSFINDVGVVQGYYSSPSGVLCGTRTAFMILAAAATDI
jgi:hypothetical protein